MIAYNLPDSKTGPGRCRAGIACEAGPEPVAGSGPDPFCPMARRRAGDAGPDPFAGSVPDQFAGSVPDPIAGSVPDPIAGSVPDPIAGSVPDPYRIR
jgi:hypothetical protein